MTITVRAFLGVCLAVVLVSAPYFTGSSGQGVMTRMLVAALFATGYNLLLGQAGLLSFGHAAFYGAGAIATVHAMIGIERGAFYIPLPLLPLVGALAGFVLALVAGFFATKRAGTYFALVTLAMAELIHVIAPMWQTVFGGEAGLTSMRMPSLGISFNDTSQVYMLTLCWTVLGIGLLWYLSRTAFGQLALALKGNEQRLRFLGFDTYKSKVLIFAISGMIAGLAGSLLSISTESASYTLFSPEVSTQVVFYVFIGGSAFFFGPAIAAAVLVALPFQLSNYTHAWPLYQGLLFMVVMLTAPNGVGGLFRPQQAGHRANYDRGAVLKRLLPGLVLVAVIAACVELSMRLGKAAILKALVANDVGLWILLGGMVIAALVFARRRMSDGSPGRSFARKAANPPGI